MLVRGGQRDRLLFVENRCLLRYSMLLIERTRQHAHLASPRWFQSTDIKACKRQVGVALALVRPGKGQKWLLLNTDQFRNRD